MSEYKAKKEEKEIKEVFADVLEEVMLQDERVVYLDADLMNSFGTAGLRKKYPHRAYDMGVQEANMIGTAAGMSAVGKKPYVHSFGPFVSRRVYDQVFLSAGYARNSLVVIGSDPGVTAAYNGGTHMPFEDIALYRTLPGAVIFDIVDTTQFRAVIPLVKDLEGVVYIRTPRKGTKQVYAAGTEFEPGKSRLLAEGADVTIVAGGIMAAEALAARELLKEEGLRAAVIDPVTIKPLDRQGILESVKATGALVSAENANVNGGLGDALASLLAEEYPAPLEKVGVRDEFGEVGTVGYLQERFGLTPGVIAEKARRAVKRKSSPRSE